MGPQQRLQEVERRPGSVAAIVVRGPRISPGPNQEPPAPLQHQSRQPRGRQYHRRRGGESQGARSDLRDLVRERPRQPLHPTHAHRRPAARTDQDAGQHPRTPPAARSTPPLQPEAAASAPETPHAGRRAVDPRRHLHRQAGRASPGPFSGGGGGRRAGERWRRGGNPNRPRVALGRTTRGPSVFSLLQFNSIQFQSPKALD
jgi:hypothetical protein